MRVKHHHNCMLCNSLKTCFVFSDFAMLFSLCRPCFDELNTHYNQFQTQDDRCSFCDKYSTVHQFEDFPDNVFFSPVVMCRSCFERLVSSIEQNKDGQ